MNTTHINLQETLLQTLRKEQVPVSMFLVNGIKLTGQIEAFDQYVVTLRNGNSSQLVYKHAISTIVPTHAFRTERQDPSLPH